MTNIITLRTRGLPLTRKAQSVDAEGNSVFLLNGDVLDPFDVCEQARKLVFPGVEPKIESAYDRAVRLRAR